MKPSHRQLLITMGRVALVLVLVLLVLDPLFARAGGAGATSSGRSSGGSWGGSSSGGSGDLFILIYLFEILFRVLGPIPTLILLGLIAFGGWFFTKRHQWQQRNTYHNLREVRRQEGSGRADGLDAFMERNPEMRLDVFLTRTQEAFMKIQDAWTRQNLGPVRRFISDGVYQRFNVQFSMMRLLEQKNILSDIQVQDLRVVKAEREGAYDILTVSISASMHDRFTCGLNAALNQEGHDSFTEYWTFLRRGEAAGRNDESAYKDILHSNKCPNCGGELPEDPGERCNCPYCNALVNSGAFDWVLCEITQSDDWAGRRALERSSRLKAQTDAMSKKDPWFSSQLLEDKASNAWLQILSARAHADPSMMRRFTTEKAFGKLSAGFGDSPIAYNRLWLNEVSLIGARADEGFTYLAFSVSTSSQRVSLEDRKARFLDPVVQQDRRVLVLRRASDAMEGKGNLYLHQCPSCGAPAADSLDTACRYCNSTFADATHEWVVDDVLTLSEYQVQFQNEKKSMNIRVNPALFDQFMDVRDFAFNNFMVMIAADGVFAQEERQMAEDLAQRLGYKIDDMESLFALAASGRMAIRMPHDVSKRDKIMDLLEKTASVDGTISAEEQAILDHMRRSYVNVGDLRL